MQVYYGYLFSVIPTVTISFRMYRKWLTYKWIIWAILVCSCMGVVAQPANDICSNAQTVTPNGTCVNGTVVNANDNLVSIAGCQSGGNNNSHLDVWYTFTATGSQFTATTTTSSPWAGNVELIVFSGSCGGTLIIMGSSCGPSPLNTTIYGLTPGNTYYVMISRQGNGTSGPFSFCPNNSNPPTTCNAPQVVSTPLSTQLCVAGTTAGGSPGPDFPNTNCYDFPNPTYWYQYTTPVGAATLTLNLSSAAMPNPYFSVFTTSDCTNYTIYNCTQGASGSAGSTITVSPGTTYLIAVSNNGPATGAFNLCLTPNPDNSACNVSKSLAATTTSMGSPLAGPYKPGELVTFCYTINQWNLLNCNYLQGIVPSFGNCWDPVSFNANGSPATITRALQTIGVLTYPPPRPSCHGQPAGTWSWFANGVVQYNNINNPSIPNGSNTGAGWYFLSSYNPLNGACSPAPTNPNNSYGDANFISCGGPLSGWQVCFRLRVRDGGCEVGNINCSVSVKTYADGEIGVWNNIGCTADLPVVFNASVAVPADTTYGAGITCDAGDAGVFTYDLTSSQGCDSVHILTITHVPPIAVAGGPNTVCQSATPAPIALGGASVGGIAGTGAWSITSGGGTLSNISQQNNAGIASTTYTPAANFSGTVTLTLTTNDPDGAGPCMPDTAIRTIEVLPLATPLFNAIPTICEGDAAPLLPGTSLNGISGNWSPQPVSTTTSATYTFTPAPPQCATTATLDVTVNPAPAISPVYHD
jgi:hypothetical protein